jgi:hypothetical protein
MSPDDLPYVTPRVTRLARGVEVVRVHGEGTRAPYAGDPHSDVTPPSAEPKDRQATRLKRKALDVDEIIGVLLADKEISGIAST